MHAQKATITLLCVCVGFVAAAALRGEIMRTEVAKETAVRLEDLQNTLAEERAKNAALALQMEEKNAELESYRTEAAKSGDYAATLAERLRSVELWSGILSAVGEGVTVTVSDSKTSVGEDGIVHDDDLRKIVNELCVAGAEGISVGGERIVSMSSIRCVGSVILVNNSRQSSPFEIRAIGDKKTLAGAINMQGGVAAVLRDIYNIDVVVKESDNVQLPPYKGSVAPKYARAEGESE